MTESTVIGIILLEVAIFLIAGIFAVKEDNKGEGFHPVITFFVFNLFLAIPVLTVIGGFFLIKGLILSQF